MASAEYIIPVPPAVCLNLTMEEAEAIRALTGSIAAGSKHASPAAQNCLAVWQALDSLLDDARAPREMKITVLAGGALDVQWKDDGDEL